jgi:hypothetical protein
MLSGSSFATCGQAKRCLEFTVVPAPAPRLVVGFA